MQQPGSFITYRHRLTLNKDSDRHAALTALRDATADTHVRCDLADVLWLDWFINQAEVFLVLLGCRRYNLGVAAGVVRAGCHPY